MLTLAKVSDLEAKIKELQAKIAERDKKDDVKTDLTPQEIGYVFSTLDTITKTSGDKLVKLANQVLNKEITKAEAEAEISPTINRIFRCTFIC